MGGEGRRLNDRPATSPFWKGRPTRGEPLIAVAGATGPAESDIAKRVGGLIGKASEVPGSEESRSGSVLRRR